MDPVVKSKFGYDNGIWFITKGNATGANNGVGTAYPSGEHEFTTDC